MYYGEYMKDWRYGWWEEWGDGGRNLLIWRITFYLTGEDKDSNYMGVSLYISGKIANNSSNVD